MTGETDRAKVRLGAHRYGKSTIRLVRVNRLADRPGVAPEGLTDLTVDVTLEGDFAAAYVEGDNSAVLPTDTMRGTVYAFAGDGPVGAVEAFGLRLARHFVETVPAVTRARVALAEEQWSRIETGDGPHPHAFLRAGPERRTATVTAIGDAGGGVRTDVRAGLTGLTVLKTAGSAFGGFLTDRYTTLEETTDRILATVLDTEWRYDTEWRGGDGEVEWDAAAQAARQALLTTFAEHDGSRSLQHTLYAMGAAALEACPEIAEVTLTASNKHHLLVDLRPYGQGNENTVFVATDAPYGLIEATVTRER